MTDEKLSFCPPPEADGNYKYFLLSATEPIRVLYDESGSVMHAESPDSDYGWVLTVNNALLDRLTNSHEVKDITKEGFIKSCAYLLENAEIETQQEPYVTPPPEADGNYKYFLLGDTRPIRVLCTKRGSSRCAESPNPERGWVLTINNVLLGRLFWSDEVEEITKAQFVAMCNECLVRAARERH
jgi:hypothetical protein